MKKIYPVFGIVGPLIYIVTVIIGGALRGDYNPVYNSISELIMVGSPNLLFLNILFGIYNFLLLLFGWGILSDPKLPKNWSLNLASVIIVILGFLGILFIFFPQDPRGTTATLSGTIHLILAGLSSPLSILAVFLAGFSFRENPENKAFVWYSYLSVLLILISGGMTATLIANNSPYGALFERITIFTFLIWVMVFSYLLSTYKFNKR